MTSTNINITKILHLMTSSPLSHLYKQLKLLTRFVYTFCSVLSPSTSNKTWNEALRSEQNKNKFHASLCALFLFSLFRGIARRPRRAVDKTTLIPTDLSRKWVLSDLYVRLFHWCHILWRLSDIKSTVRNRSISGQKLFVSCCRL